MWIESETIHPTPATASSREIACCKITKFFCIDEISYYFCNYGKRQDSICVQ